MWRHYLGGTASSLWRHRAGNLLSLATITASLFTFSLFLLVIANLGAVVDRWRDQMTELRSSPKLSAADHQRLQLHFDSIQDLSSSLSCNLTAEQEAALDGASAGYDSDIGDEVLSALRTHMDIAALAVGCGYTRSVAMQVGNGNDSATIGGITFNRAWTVTPNAPAANLKMITLTVTWGDRQGNHTVSNQTIRGQ